MAKKRPPGPPPKPRQARPGAPDSRARAGKGPRPKGRDPSSGDLDDLMTSPSGTDADIDLDEIDELAAEFVDEPAKKRKPKPRSRPPAKKGKGKAARPEDLPDAFGEAAAPAQPTTEADALGPAFADDFDEVGTGEFDDFDDSGFGSTGQVVAATATDGQVLDPQDAVTGTGQADGDPWDGFEDKSGWDSVTGQKLPPAGKDRPEPPEPEPQDPEYSRQQTNVFAKGKKGKPDEGARLVCIRGADDGREFPAHGREMGVGRDPKNELTLTEASVSRNHATILYDGNKYTLVDNNSGNGTYVNGERISRARIRSGDEVCFGNGVFRFLEIGDVFKPVDASGSPILPGARRAGTLDFFAGRKGVAVGSGIVVLAAIAVVAILVVRAASSGTDPEVTYRYYMQGIEAFKRRDWGQAETAFTVMLGHDPLQERGKRYLQAVGEERKAEQQFKEAKAALERRDHAQAYSSLKAIRNSVYAPEALAMQQTIDTLLDEAVGEARTALEQRNPTKAMELLEAVEAVRPGRPEVAALMDKARGIPSAAADAAGDDDVGDDEAEAEPVAEETPPDSGNDGAGPATARAEPTSGREREPPREREPAGGDKGSKGIKDDTISEAKKLVGVGKLADAKKILAKAKDKRTAAAMKKKIDKFDSTYKSALTDHRARKTDTAIKKFKQAKAYEAKITGGNTRLSAEIRRKLADMHYIDGFNCLKKEDKKCALKHFKKALAVFPDHGPTKKKMPLAK